MSEPFGLYLHLALTAGPAALSHALDVPMADPFDLSPLQALGTSPSDSSLIDFQRVLGSTPREYLSKLRASCNEKMMWQCTVSTAAVDIAALEWSENSFELGAGFSILHHLLGCIGSSATGYLLAHDSIYCGEAWGGLVLGDGEVRAFAGDAAAISECKANADAVCAAMSSKVAAAWKEHGSGDMPMDFFTDDFESL